MSHKLYFAITAFAVIFTLSACSDGGDSDSATNSDDAGTLSEVATELCDNYSAPMAGQRRDGQMQQIVLSDPEAVCNDGTPASVYIRRATNPDHAGRWLVYFKGGNQCLDWGDCVDRWCGDSGNLMTSLGHGPSKYRDGIMNPDLPDNAFGGWNHVYVPYCTSDLHSGTGDNILMVDPNDEDPSYTMHFKGNHVMNAVMDLLEAGAKSDDGTETLTPIGDAGLVLVSGSSAGGGSITLNLDHIAARLSSVDVRGLIDSHGNPEPQHFTEPTSGNAATFGVTHLENSYKNSYMPLWNQVVDESCRAANPAASDTAWRCSDSGYMQMNHITTPFFARQDLLDGNLAAPFFLPEPDGAGADHLAYSTAAVAWLEAIHRADTDGVEAGKIDVKPGVFGPRCRHHTSLGSNAYFTKDFIEDGDEMSSFHDALTKWLTGTPTKWIDPPGEGKIQGCPVDD